MLYKGLIFKIYIGVWMIEGNNIKSKLIISIVNKESWFK